MPTNLKPEPPAAAEARGFDPCVCPLCGAQNGCALELRRRSGLPQPPCWCAAVGIERALLERVPPALRRVACVCAACARLPS